MSAEPAATWTRALEQIEALMRRSLALAVPPEAPAPPADLEAPLRRLDERLAQLPGRLAQAERDSAEADALLLAATAEAQTWQGRVARARETLAAWAGRAV